MKRSIYLSPSTQEHNVGVGSYGNEEMQMNRLADIVEELLTRQGIQVYRNKPDWSLQRLVQDSNSKEVSLHLALHSNAGGAGKVRGCEVFAYTPGGNSEKAARAIYAELEPLTPAADRGVKFNPKLYELKETLAPAILVEIGFHDNKEDAHWISNHLEDIGKALAKGSLKYLGVSYVERTSELDKALQLLQEFDLLQSSEYWRNNAVKGKTVAGEHAATLIQRVAAYILKGGIR